MSKHMSKAEGAKLGITITDGEYPVSGDDSRIRYALWRTFSFPSVWTYAGVRA